MLQLGYGWTFIGERVMKRIISLLLSLLLLSACNEHKNVALAQCKIDALKAKISQDKLQDYYINCMRISGYAIINLFEKTTSPLCKNISDHAYYEECFEPISLADKLKP